MTDTIIQITPEERRFQYQIMTKYSDQKIIPTIQDIAMKTGAGVTTVAMFMHGNSTNPKIRKFVTDILKKKLDPIPDDLIKLFKIWDR